MSSLKRVLSLFDLTLLLVIAVVNLNLVPVVASAGLSVLSLWLLGFLFFFLPQAVAVMELSARYPQEGGIYVWSKIAFGDEHGFLSGWCYWTNNVFYIPTLLFYLVGFSVFIGGERTLGLAENKLYIICLSVIFLWVLIWLNIIGLGLGKWVQNAGAFGALITTVAIIVIASIALNTRGMANPINLSVLLPDISEWRTVTMLGVVCFAFVGLELGSVMGDEIKEPGKNIPRSVVISGLLCILLYGLSTFALQATIPVKDIGVIEGLLQAISRVATEIEVPSVLPLLALLLSISICGATCAWLAGSARIPFVIGIDRYLPEIFSRMHPRYNTPYMALIIQGVASTLFILINSIGSTVRDIYLILLNTAVIIQLVPFLYMFGALIKVRRSPEEDSKGFFKNSWPCYLAGFFGFLITALGILLAFIPAQGVKDVWAFELKTVFGSAVFIIPAILLFRFKYKNTKAAEIVKVPLCLCAFVVFSLSHSFMI